MWFWEFLLLFLQKQNLFFSPAGIKVSAQNIHWEESGAFTGETSCSMLTEIGVEMAIIGHSERRTLFRETNEEIRSKMTKALSSSVTPIFCVGETIEERKSGKTFSILEEQLGSALKNQSLSPQNFMIAYEPVWAIGTGLTATKEEAHEAHSFIRSYMREHFGEALSEGVRILYGGSMKAEVTADLLSSPEIDGGLIGGASLKPETFSAMLNVAYEMTC